ncbi:DUF2938 family protein [Pluralibacter gergoviae]|nr:DUF2938 family protein [Pluralibacter gergoviae]ELC3016174.1 DUF2938 family protein [Pluralibacter gergoviae]ELC3021154.1 DUF2938 family protein [Pluralibacter gergoviae]
MLKLLPLGVMQPAFGFSIAATKTPRPGKARLMSLLAHLMYSAGLFVMASMLMQAGG